MSLNDIFKLIGGLGLFIYGINVMSDGLQKAAGNRLKRIFELLTNNILLGVLVGALVTAIVQSSSASTVMVVGFVNAGLMTLKQATGVIMGANIGTTVTAFIVALKLTEVAPVFVGIGVALIIFTKKKSVRQLGEILTGFGVLFIGMDFMSSALKPLRGIPEFAALMKSFSVNPILGVLAGFAVTVILQSSSASVAVLQSLALAGAIEMDAALPILFGQNIGTCVTAMISSVGASVTAKRAAVVHLLFNVIGTTMFLIIIYVGGGIFTNYTQGTTNPFVSAILRLDPGDVVQQIANTHIIFNVTTTLILLPFAGLLVKASTKLIKSKEEPMEAGVKYIDDRLLETPAIAVNNAVKEAIRMGRIAQQNYGVAMEAFFKADERLVEDVYRREEIVNQLEKDITSFLVKLSSRHLTDEQAQITTGLFHTINDIERIGDHSDNLAELAQYSIENKLKFSETAIKELEGMVEIVNGALDNCLTALDKGDFSLARVALSQEDEVDRIEKELRTNHIGRLNNQLCVPGSGVVFLDIISNLERIADHCSNIALYVLDREK